MISGGNAEALSPFFIRYCLGDMPVRMGATEEASFLKFP